MRNWKLVSLGLVLCLALAATGFAATPPAAKPSHAEGRIVAVDTPSKTLTLKVGGRLEKFVLASTSQILASGKSVAAAALTKGETARVEYSQQNGHAVVSKLEVLGGTTPAKSSPR